MKNPFKVAGRRHRDHDLDVDTSVASRIRELAEIAAAMSLALATAADAITRASLMAALASVEEETAALHEVAFRAASSSLPKDVALPAALRSSAALLRLIAATEDAPEAEEFLARMPSEYLAPGVDRDLALAARPHLRKLATTGDSKARAELLVALHAVLVPIVGTTAAETVAWLADVAAGRADSGVGM